MAVTQKDIAREVGVVQSVVSDVLQGRNDGRMVSSETRQRILATAGRLGYQPNASARALRTRRSHQVVYVTAQEDRAGFDPLEEPVMAVVARALARSGYRLVIGMEPLVNGDVSALQKLIASGVCDGCIVRSFEERPALWEALKSLNKPFIVIGQCSDPEIASVFFDMEGIVSTTVDHLVQLGHREVGLVLPWEHGASFRLFREHWDAIAPARGLLTRDRVAVADTRKKGETAAARWLAAPDAPTAVVSLHGYAAVGVITAAQHLGRKIGDNFDLIAIRRKSESWAYAPGTWCLDTDMSRPGVRAAGELLRSLAGHAPAGPVRVLPEMTQCGEE